jgi:phage-related protein
MSGDVLFRVAFFRSASGTEPVRIWLKGLDRADRKSIGEDIKTVQYFWPLGLPLVRKIATDLWEVRSTLDHRIARVMFTVQEGVIVLLHGFIKKSQRTPPGELKIAKRRLRQTKANHP